MSYMRKSFAFMAFAAMTPERERAILAKMEREMHNFNIHGVVIRARNRKTALKIYSRMKRVKK